MATDSKTALTFLTKYTLIYWKDNHQAKRKDFKVYDFLVGYCHFHKTLIYQEAGKLLDEMENVLVLEKSLIQNGHHIII